MSCLVTLVSAKQSITSTSAISYANPTLNVNVTLDPTQFNIFEVAVPNDSSAVSPTLFPISFKKFLMTILLFSFALLL